MAYIGREPGSGVRTRHYFTATGGETSLSGTDDNGAELRFSDGTFVDVSLNGVALVAGTDYNTTTPNTIAGLSALASGDIVEIIVYEAFAVADAVSANLGGTFRDNIAITGDLTVDTDTFHVDSTNNRVGINQASPAHPVHVGTDDLIVDASGNVLVGTTDSIANVTSSTGQGVAIQPDRILVSSTQVPAQFNRQASNGNIIGFRKDGSTVGSISSSAAGGGSLVIGNGTVGLMFRADLTGSAFIPANPSTVSQVDNTLDVGHSAIRFDDVYATNGTIQTSDQNEKQQIAALTDAEITAAKAISALFKTFKWNDAVSEKGDAARTHAGVIAQDVEAAMTAAGLDAGDYAFFISSTWYVDADGNEVEADAEGAIEKNRKGIRYPELLAFVGAATEQRLANIETRIAALENA